MSVARNPKDSMKSTWRQADKSQWTVYERLYEILGIQPSKLDQKVPVHSKQDKVPYVPDWHLHRWILVHALIPIGLHALYVHFTHRNLHPIAAFLFYTISFKLIAIHQLNSMCRLGHRYGFLDGDKHARDGVPDIAVRKVLHSLISTSTFRSVMAVMLSYRTSQTPASISWTMLPLEIGLYGIVLDFWFYWYHRLMHEVDGLWQYHRTHHLTKHPNPLLTLYADTEQEIFDIAVIPLLAYLCLKLMGFPMGFYEWWICQQYVVFTELSGHSGLRIFATPPSTLTWLLRFFDADLAIEDHDMHHRQGWKKSGNYGKQTRLWDLIFGTCQDRVESAKGNIDYENPACIPLI